MLNDMLNSSLGYGYGEGERKGKVPRPTVRGRGRQKVANKLEQWQTGRHQQAAVTAQTRAWACGASGKSVRS